MNKNVYSAFCLAGAVALTGLTSCTSSQATPAEQRAPSAAAQPATQAAESTEALSGTPAERRAAVLKASRQGADGLPTLKAAMRDPNVMVRRTAVRGLGEVGQPAIDLLDAAAKNDADPLVRRTALRELVRLQGDKALPELAQALQDKDAMVRQTAVEALSHLQPRTEAITRLLRQAQRDKDTGVSQLANSVLWPFHKKAESVTQQPEFKDHQLTLIQSIPLPTDGWRFMTDPHQTGQLSKWYEPGFNDSGWSKIKIGEVWETQGHTSYDGAAWYRRTIKLPAKPAGAVGTDLTFDGVDESAWVWVNGQYVGDHDIGTAGWNKPFSVDVSEALKWGQENQITVRVLDRAQAGGIWKPVHVDVYKQ